MHARGSGAHGHFQVYESLEAITKAGFLCDPSRSTPVFVRFSTVAGSRGSADTVRDVRGFATKFYTAGGRLRPGRQQHPGLLHPGRDQVPGRHPRRQAGAPQRDPAGPVGARHLLGLHLPDARVDAHGDVGHVRPGHPPQLPDDGRLRGEHLPAGQRGRRRPAGQVPLEAPARGALAGLGRGPAPGRGRPGLPPARPVERHRAGGVSAVRARPAADRGAGRAVVPLRPAGRDQDLAGGAGAGAAGGPADPRPQPGQLLRRDGAGRLPPGQRRAGDRLLQRPAAPGAPLLLPGHPADPAGRAELPRAADQPLGGAGAQQPARRLHAPHGEHQPHQLPAQLPRRRLPLPGGGGPRRLRQRRRARRRAEDSRSAARASATTSARPGCSGSARPRTSRSTSSAPCASSWARCRTWPSGSGWWTC